MKTTLKTSGTSKGAGGLGLLRGLLLASAALVPACSFGNSGGPNSGVTGALWNSTSGSGSPSDGPPGALLWNDPNTAPIPNPQGAVGNLTYGQADPTDYGAGPPPSAGAAWMNSALSVASPQNPTTQQDEQAIEGYALAYHASLVNLGGGGGLGGGLGGLGGLNQQPPLYSSQNMELEPRGYCEMELQPAGPVMSGPGDVNLGAQATQWRLQQCGINMAMQNAAEFPVASGAGIATAQDAWNAMAGAGAQMWIQNIQASGYCGAGSWSLNGTTWWDLTFIDLPLGQIP